MFGKFDRGVAETGGRHVLGVGLGGGVIGNGFQRERDLRRGGAGQHRRSGPRGRPRSSRRRLGGRGREVQGDGRARGPRGPRSRREARGLSRRGSPGAPVLLRPGDSRSVGGRAGSGCRGGARGRSSAGAVGAGVVAGGTSDGGSSGGAWSWASVSPAFKRKPQNPQAKMLLTIVPSRSGNLPRGTDARLDRSAHRSSDHPFFPRSARLIRLHSPTCSLACPRSG